MSRRRLVRTEQSPVCLHEGGITVLVRPRSAETLNSDPVESHRSSWLVTGGAGYVGRHVVRSLLRRGLTPVVYDDLSTGELASLPARVPLVRGCVTDQSGLTKALSDHRAVGVIHLAARTSVPESVCDPCGYHQTNAVGALCLARAMLDTGTRLVVHTSSAAVYAPPQGRKRVIETSVTVPANPYGRSKLLAEWILADVAQAHGLRVVNLRLFNLAGAGAGAGALVPGRGGAGVVDVMLGALAAGRRPVVHGLEYATPDGSAVRDFVHVGDVARACVSAASALASGLHGGTYNIGRGCPISVLEVLATAQRIAGVRRAPRIGPPREGDVAAMVCSPAAAARDLGWRPRRGLDEMVSSSWAHRRQLFVTAVPAPELAAVAT